MNSTAHASLPLAPLALALAASTVPAPEEQAVDTAPTVRVAAAEIQVPDALRAAVAHEDRPAAERARDAHRMPAEVLAFFGIEEGMQVAEMMAGTGYYTEILSQVVGPDGRVYAQNNEYVLKRFAEKPLTALIARLPYDNVVKLDAEVQEALPGPDGEGGEGGEGGGLDAAMLVRFYHDFYWQECDRAGFNRAIFAALKPGGVFGVIDHHAEPGSGSRDVQSLHRVERDMVVAEILAAGFVLEAETDLLANPDDTHDWNIFADQAARRDQTDRFVLRFRKPIEPVKSE